MSTQPVSMALAPLYWLLDEKIPQNEEPTVDNFKKCYEARCKENKKPGSLEERSLLEILALLAGVGGLVYAGYSYLKNSRIGKFLGSILTLGGIGTFIYGFVKSNRISKLIGSLISTLVSQPINTDNEKKKPTHAAKDSATSQGEQAVKTSESRALMVIALNGLDTPGQKISVDDLQKRPISEQVKFISQGLLKLAGKKTTNFRFLGNDEFKLFIGALAGVNGVIAIECLNVIRLYITGGLKFEESDTTRASTIDGKPAKGRSYYDVLGVTQEATEDEIKQAFRKKARECHPDTNPGKEVEATKRFCELNKAYETLSDPAKRKQYDGF